MHPLPARAADPGLSGVPRPSTVGRGLETILPAAEPGSGVGPGPCGPSHTVSREMGKWPQGEVSFTDKELSAEFSFHIIINYITPSLF